MFDSLNDKFDWIAWGVAFILWIANEIRKWILKKREKKKVNTGLDIDSAIHASIDNILWQMLSIYRASRCFVMQFHNGDYYYTGQSRIRLTITNEVVYPGVKKMTPEYNGVQVSESMHRLMGRIKIEEHVYISSVDLIKDEPLVDLMMILEIKSFIMIRLADSRTGETVALLWLHFPFNYPLDKKQIGTLLQSKRRLEAIFDRL